MTGRAMRSPHLAIAAGGALGAYLRLGVAEALPVEPGRWPWSTFLVNLAGAALLAYVATRLLERMPPSALLRPFWGTGLCGALTTFSTVQVEAITLRRDGHAGLACAYYAVSVGAGLAAAWLATGAVRRARVRLA